VPLFSISAEPAQGYDELIIGTPLSYLGASFLHLAEAKIQPFPDTLEFLPWFLIIEGEFHLTDSTAAKPRTP